MKKDMKLINNITVWLVLIIIAYIIFFSGETTIIDAIKELCDPDLGEMITGILK